MGEEGDETYKCLLCNVRTYASNEEEAKRWSTFMTGLANERGCARRIRTDDAFRAETIRGFVRQMKMQKEVLSEKVKEDLTTRVAPTVVNRMLNQYGIVEMNGIVKSEDAVRDAVTNALADTFGSTKKTEKKKKKAKNGEDADSIRSELMALKQGKDRMNAIGSKLLKALQKREKKKLMDKVAALISLRNDMDDVEHFVKLLTDSTSLDVALMETTKRLARGAKEFVPKSYTPLGRSAPADGGERNTTSYASNENFASTENSASSKTDNERVCTCCNGYFSQCTNPDCAAFGGQCLTCYENPGKM